MTAPGLYGGPVLVASVLSLKGGVGKTTVTLGLASAAVHRGVDTLLVDLDPQMNATTTVDPESAGGSNGHAGGRRWTVAEVLDDPSRKVIDKAIRVSAWGESLRLLPGSERTENHNHPDPGSKTLFRLANALAKVSPLPELVLVDCPPSLGQLTRSALTAADRAVLVTEPSLFAVTGVQRALEAVQTERLAHRPALQPLGVVINRFRPRVTEHEYRLAELRDLFGPLVLVAGAARPFGGPAGAGRSGPDPSVADRGCPRGRAELRRAAGPADAVGASEGSSLTLASGVRGSCRPARMSTSSRKAATCRTMSSASRALTRRWMPASAACRLAEPAAKNAAHSENSGATLAISSQALPRRPRTGRALAASTAAAARNAARCAAAYRSAASVARMARPNPASGVGQQVPRRLRNRRQRTRIVPTAFAVGLHRGPPLRGCRSRGAGPPCTAAARRAVGRPAARTQDRGGSLDRRRGAVEQPRRIRRAGTVDDCADRHGLTS